MVNRCSSASHLSRHELHPPIFNDPSETSEPESIIQSPKMQRDQIVVVGGPCADTRLNKARSHVLGSRLPASGHVRFAEVRNRSRYLKSRKVRFPVCPFVLKIVVWSEKSTAAYSIMTNRFVVQYARAIEDSSSLSTRELGFKKSFHDPRWFLYLRFCFGF